MINNQQQITKIIHDTKLLLNIRQNKQEVREFCSEMLDFAQDESQPLEEFVYSRNINQQTYEKLKRKYPDIKLTENVAKTIRVDKRHSMLL